MTSQQNGGQLVEVRWHRVVDPAVLAALAAIVCDTVSPVDDTTGHPTGQPTAGSVTEQR